MKRQNSPRESPELREERKRAQRLATLEQERRTSFLNAFNIARENVWFWEMFNENDIPTQEEFSRFFSPTPEWTDSGGITGELTIEDVHAVAPERFHKRLDQLSNLRTLKRTPKEPFKRTRAIISLGEAVAIFGWDLIPCAEFLGFVDLSDKSIRDVASEFRIPLHNTRSSSPPPIPLQVEEHFRRSDPGVTSSRIVEEIESFLFRQFTGEDWQDSPLPPDFVNKISRWLRELKQIGFRVPHGQERAKFSK